MASSPPGFDGNPVTVAAMDTIYDLYLHGIGWWAHWAFEFGRWVLVESGTLA